MASILFRYYPQFYEKVDVTFSSHLKKLHSIVKILTQKHKLWNFFTRFTHEKFWSKFQVRKQNDMDDLKFNKKNLHLSTFFEKSVLTSGEYKF